MSIYALSDLHLALDDPGKTMEVFGALWSDYMNRIRENCGRVLTDSDTILMPGDLSWVMYMEDGIRDFEFIENIPGRKLIGRGNHDYFWSTAKKMDEYFKSRGFNSIEIVKNNAIEVEDALVTGTRGWRLPSEEGFTPDDEKVWNREVQRLAICLSSLEKADPGHKKRHIVMLHYPPLTRRDQHSKMTELMEEHKADICIYGHLHGRAHNRIFEGRIPGGCVNYICVSGDYRKFEPVKL